MELSDLEKNRGYCKCVLLDNLSVICNTQFL